MACKTLILGVLFSIGIFAVKSGVGLHYFLSVPASTRRKAWGAALFAALYLALFIIFQRLVGGMEIARHLTTLQAFIRHGMAVHLLMAGLMALWGLRLLRRGDRSAGASRGWLLLVLPCPVCATVIFLSLGFLNACYPGAGISVALLLFCGFALIHLLAVLTLAAGRRGRGTPPEPFLGGAMLLIAVYFLLSVTVMPQFADVDKIYRMALASSKAPPQPLLMVVFFIFSASAAFTAGFAAKHRAIRRRS